MIGPEFRPGPGASQSRFESDPQVVETEEVENIPEKRWSGAGREDRKTGLDHDTKWAIMMDVCPAELDRHLLLSSDSFVTDPTVRAAIRDHVGQLRHKSDPMEVGEKASSAEGE